MKARVVTRAYLARDQLLLLTQVVTKKLVSCYRETPSAFRRMVQIRISGQNCLVGDRGVVHRQRAGEKPVSGNTMRMDRMA
jgi:hypothetical protein